MGIPSRPASPEPDDLALRRSCAAHVLVGDLDDPEGPVLDEPATHHLGRVLRLRSGTEVCATDGRGGWRVSRFVGSERLEPLGPTRRQDAPAEPVTVAFVPVKRDRAELVVQKLTELGVDRIVITTSARAVVRWDGERSDRHVERLGKVAREALQQCRRLWLPELASADLGELLAGGAALADLGAAPGPIRGGVPIVVGPEGGWTDEERSMATVPSVDLGEHVLRAETAAIAAGVLLAERRRSSARS